MANALPAIVLEGLNRYQQSKSTPKPTRAPLTREQRIARLLNRYASAKLTFRKPETWGAWAKERDAMLAEARNLINFDTYRMVDHIVSAWENDLSEDELTRRAKSEYVTWTNNPARPWNAGDNEIEENVLVYWVAYLAGKPCYQILYDHS